MKNLGQMLKQAQEMQTRMAELQEKLGEHELEGVAGGGMVKVIMNGKGEVRGVKIDPALADPNDIEVLEDLLVAAAADAKSKVEVCAQEEMQKVAGGLSLPPGFKLPF